METIDDKGQDADRDDPSLDRYDFVERRLAPPPLSQHRTRNLNVLFPVTHPGILPKMDARPGLEPGYVGFKDPCLTNLANAQ